MTPTRKLVHDISASAVQLLVMQLSGAVIFYLLSNFLPKQDIGLINWCLAVLMIFYAILGCGIDQIAVKKIATGTNPVTFLPAYLLHLLISGIGFLLILWMLSILFNIKAHSTVFLLLALSQFLLYISAPFKQVANGFEQFSSLLVMSVAANIIRVTGLGFLIFFNGVSLITVVWLYIFSSLIELIACIIVYYFSLCLPIRLQWNSNKYILLIKESLPQLGIIFFTAVIARVDWVLLGLFCSTTIVADYSFSYKFFELSTLPLLIIGPLLVPKIARLFRNGLRYLPKESNDLLIGFIKTEIIIALGMILAINICWTPVIDLITEGKYGHNNAKIVFILSLCSPFLYINNILWSLHFSQGRLKEILKVFIITAVVNITADLVLIPLYKGNGAAIGFGLSMLIQTIFYLQKTSLYGYMRIFWNLALISLSAIIAWYISGYLFTGMFGVLFCSITIYIVLLLSIKKINFRENIFLNSLIKIENSLQ